MKNTSPFSIVAQLVFVAFVIGGWIAIIGGWIANIVKLFGGFDLSTTETLVRLIGVVISPLGVIMGYL